MKPVFDVKSLSKAEEQVALRGGVVTKVTFTLNGVTRRDVVDPEGNVIQLRSASL
jgi:predicted enzyme related to lactoylglutathione lyase